MSALLPKEYLRYKKAEKENDKRIKVTTAALPRPVCLVTGMQHEVK